MYNRVIRVLLLLFFGMASYVVATPLGSQVVCQDLAVQSGDNKIVVAGTTLIDNVKRFFAARYLPDGTLDNSFGTNGAVTTLINARCEAFALALDTSGNIVVVGGSQGDLAIVRYTPSGQLDTSFGTTGIVITPVNNNALGHDIAIQSDSKILVIGFTGTTEHIVLLRFNADGTPDTSFGNNGVIETMLNNRSFARSVVIQSDNKIVLGGYSVVAPTGINVGIVVRYASNGQIDTNFGDQGVVTVENGLLVRIHDVQLQPDGKIIAVANVNNTIVVYRFNQDGSLDTAFGIAGSHTFAQGDVSIGNFLSIQSDGKIVVAGVTDDDIMLFRLTAGGALDTTFANNGIMRVKLESIATLNAVGIRPSDQHIIACGTVNNNALLIQLDPDGFFDNDFGQNGNGQNPGGSFVGSSAREAMIWEKQSTGTNGGTFQAGLWKTRTLNTLVGDVGFIALANNQFTLQPGRYRIVASSPAYRVDQHQIRLYNVTDSRVEENGTSEFSTNFAKATTTRSFLQHTLFINEVWIFEIQHRCDNTRTGTGLGFAVGFAGNDEVYTQVQITRLL